MEELEAWRDSLAELRARQKQERARFSRKSPKPIGIILSDLMARRGYARQQSCDQLRRAWQQAIEQLKPSSQLASRSCVGRLRRGVLEVWVANSTIHQELIFDKPAILHHLDSHYPDLGVRDLRFRVGRIQRS